MKESVQTTKSYSYWKNVPSTNVKNSPKQYTLRNALSKELYDRGNAHLDFNESMHILEIGCNAGRNLSYFYECGFRHLHGIEISPQAFAYGEEVYPGLYKDCDMKLGRAKDQIRNLTRKNMDVTFTSAVLLHIDDAERKIILDWIAKHSSHAIFVEPFKIPMKKYKKDGRLFNPIDIAKEMSNRGWKSLLYKKPTGGRMGATYEMVILSKK